VKVQLTTEMVGIAESGVVFSHVRGEVLDLPPVEAKRAVAAGIAKAVGGKAEKIEPAAEEPADAAAGAAPPK
jgi:hypothetical protein